MDSDWIRIQSDLIGFGSDLNPIQSDPIRAEPYDDGFYQSNTSNVFCSNVSLNDNTIVRSAFDSFNSFIQITHIFTQIMPNLVLLFMEWTTFIKFVHGYVRIPMSCYWLIICTYRCKHQLQMDSMLFRLILIHQH